MGLSKRSLFVLSTSLVMASSTVLFAQPAPGDGGGQGGGGGGRGQGGGGGRGQGGGNWDPAQMRERMAQRMKEQLGVTDEEYAVLQPKLEAVQLARLESASGGGMGGMFGGRGGRGGGGGGGPGGGGPGGGGGGGGNPMMEAMQNSPVAKASKELRDVLEDKGAAADSIKAKVEALRKARVEAKEKLTKAQAELKELVTPRQEAVLVEQGTLE